MRINSSFVTGADFSANLSRVQQTSLDSTFRGSKGVCHLQLIINANAFTSLVA